MNRFVACAILVVTGGAHAWAQTSLDVIQDDMRQAKLQHDDASSQQLTTFLDSLQQASDSPATALDLYQKAGGSLPDLAPVKTHYVYETPTEKAAREALDMQNEEQVAVVIQVHCGLMRQAALLTVESKKPDVQAQWLAWLKSIAAVYPQMAGHRALKDVAMRDSVVGHYLQFRGWGTGDPGRWAVSDLPRLYHEQVLEPLRKAPSQETLDAWDAYTAMMQADEPDKDKWTQEEEPNLGFERAADDFAMQPNMDKLTTLDGIIKANPNNEHLDDWLQRMQQMIQTYRQGGSSHTPQPAATPSAENGAATPTVTPGTPSPGPTALQ